jgi:murein DD-endopeptidase MepM/ murein hydrolase activator NlpD
MKKKLGLAALAAALVSATFLVAPSAYAAARNGVCESGEFCLYYNSDNTGSVSDFAGSISNYSPSTGCYKFVSSGAGHGVCVKNNAASVWNRTAAVVTVFYKSGYAGAIDSIPSGASPNLNANLKNENAGHRFGSTSRTALSNGPYNGATGHISAYFDGYLNTSGRHEGIDIARALGTPVYAMVSGTVTRVTQGARGSGGLSTIAIYNSSLNKTIVYLHTNPLNLSVGQSISRGQHIAYEDWRGVSSESAAHTHVEMRLGKQTAAAVSVGDPVLDNPNPTTFWEARGYNICCA